MLYLSCQGRLDHRTVNIYPNAVDYETDEQARRAFGQRLAAARELVGMTQTDVGKHFGCSKGTVSAWETGRGDPGVFKLKTLAKMYRVSADALLWDNAPSLEAMQIAAEFDGLTPSKQSLLRAIWVAYITQSADDETVEKRMPVTSSKQRQSHDLG